MTRAHHLFTTGELADMLTEAAAIGPCDDCTGRPAVCIEDNGYWEAVAVHDSTCPDFNRRYRTE